MVAVREVVVHDLVITEGVMAMAMVTAMATVMVMVEGAGEGTMCTVPSSRHFVISQQYKS